NVPLAVLLPYCDGDVDDLQGVHFYDDARYNVPGDVAPKHTILVLGANHNFYNTIWTPSLFPAGTSDDGGPDSDPFCGATVSGNGRLSDAQQRAGGLVYVSAFLRVYVGGESQFLPLLTSAAPPPPSAATSKIYVSFHAPDDAASRRDVNRWLDQGHLATNTLGGTVTQNALSPYDVCGGPLPQAAFCLAGVSGAKQPHNVPSLLSSAPGMSQLTAGWSNVSGTLTNNIPPGLGNVSGFQALQFRASVNFNDVRNAVGLMQNFTVTLTDGTSNTASVRPSDLSPALFYPPGASASSTVPRVVLNTVRLPLSAFAGLNFTDIRPVQFHFDQTAQGALLVTDIAFVTSANITLPTAVFDRCIKDDASGAELQFSSVTGAYQYCCGTTTVTGVGRLTVQGTVTILQQGAGENDRRLTARIDRSTNRGSATLQFPVGHLLCSIVDRNILNNTSSCN